MRDKIRFGVVGCGRMGMRRIKMIVEHTNSELICVADVQEEKAKAIGREFGVDYYMDFNQVTNKRDIDCVVISVPNKFHADIVVRALAEEKHVLCEKPLARDPKEAKAMVEVAEKNGVTLKVSSNLRYFPSVQKGKELLREIGEILFFRGWIGNSGWQLKGWFSNPEMIGGGALLDNGCHLLDLCLWLLGDAEECSGRVAKMYHSLPDPLEDNAFGLFKFANGAVASVHSSWTEWADYMYAEIYGTEGYIRIDNRIPNCITTIGRKDGSQLVYDFSKLPPQSYDAEFDHYMKSLMNNSYPVPSGRDGLKVVQMVYGVYESAKTGKVIRLPREEM